MRPALTLRSGSPPRWSPRWPSPSGRWPRTPRGRPGARPARCSRRCRPSEARAAARAWALTLFYFMAFGGFVAMFLYLPKLLVDVHDLSKTDAGARAAGFALLAVVARPIGGALSDRVGARDGADRLVRRHGGAGARPCRVLRAHGPADDRLPDDGRLPRPRHGRRLQARPRVVPRPGRRRHRGRRRGRRARRLLPAARDGARQVADGRLCARLRPDGRGRRDRPDRAPGRSSRADRGTHGPGGCRPQRDTLGPSGPTAGQLGVERRPRPPAGAPVLRPARSARQTAGTRPRPTRATGRPPTGGAGSTTASSAPPTASTAPGRARGRSTSRTASSPGRPSRPTTPRTAPTPPTTSRAAARAGPRSPGTSTRRCGPSIRTCAGSCSRCIREARRAPRRPGRGLGVDRRGPRARPRLQVAARQGRLRPRVLGRRRRAGRRRPRPHGPPLRARPDRRLLADPGDVDGLLHGRDPLPLADRRRLPLLLRLVRRPAARLAADLGRPDRRPRVGRLVELLLHDPLGLEHPPDADPGRPLHDRGPLQGPEGRRRLARLRRAHEVRRPLAARRAPAPTARWRWRWAT